MDRLVATPGAIVSQELRAGIDEASINLGGQAILVIRHIVAVSSGYSDGIQIEGDPCIMKRRLCNHDTYSLFHC